MALRSSSRRQSVWVNSMQRTWAETFRFESRCELSGFSFPRESTEELLSHTQAVFATCFSHPFLTHRQICCSRALTISCIVIQSDKYAKEKEGGGGGKQLESSCRRDWHTAQLAQTHCPLHPNYCVLSFSHSRVKLQAVTVNV